MGVASHNTFWGLVARVLHTVLCGPCLMPSVPGPVFDTALPGQIPGKTDKRFPPHQETTLFPRGLSAQWALLGPLGAVPRGWEGGWLLSNAESWACRAGEGALCRLLGLCLQTKWPLLLSQVASEP